MVRLLLLAALAAFASVACAHPWIHPRTHVGALNHRLSREELFRPAQPADPIQPQWITQQLDHNDLSSTATFQQRYFVNDTFWTPSAPIVFFMIGGEGPVSPAYVGDHFIIGELAATFGAMIVTLEHRFYGQSVPNGDSSTANLKYLSSSAALEDMVTFRQHMMDTRSMSANTKWIVFGGSYSGALAGFARAKYPNLWMGAFATSAPVQAQLDFSQYFEVVAQSVGADCTANIAASTATLTQLLASNRAQLVSDFNLCAAPANDNDAMNFVSTLSGPISGIVQYNDDNNAYEMYDIPIMCSKLMGADNALDGLKTVWNDYNAFSNNTACTDISYSGMIASMQPTSDARSWTWQTCNEFGYFQSAEGTSQPFSSLISLQSFLQQCVDIFGIPNFTPNTRFINDYYGGNQIVSTNTVFANGDVDPWHILGNYQTYEPAAASDTILIHGTAHCADLYPARAADVSGLTQARRTQASLLAIWLDSEAIAPAAAPTAASKKPAAAHKPKIVLKHE